MTLTLVDTHCHLDSPRFDEDREQVLERAFGAGVGVIVVPGVGPQNWEPLLSLPKRESRLRVGLGVHPQLLPELPESEDGALIEQLEALLGRGGAVAVGECGLDGPSVPGASVERQVKVLREHFRLARKVQLPLLIHCFRLHPAFQEVLREETPLPEAGVLLHSYSGGAELARGYAKAGCYFSLAGPVTYPGARKPIASLEAIPRERLVMETDAPDQAPHPYRGQRSEPGYLRVIAEGMARALGVSVEEIAERTTENARALFQW
jgi:TatD DNase family protein